jgi:hypothetical protein
MSLPIIQPKSEISIISRELIEINYEVNRSGKIIYFLKRYSLFFMLPFYGGLFFLDDAEGWFFGIMGLGFIIYYLAQYFIKLPIHTVKQAIITPEYLQLSYHDNFEKLNKTLKSTLDNLDYLDFEINIYDDGSTVAIQNIEIPLYDAAGFHVLVDVIANMLDLEYSDTARLSDETEILTYKSKTVSQINFPSLLNIESDKDSIKIIRKKAYLEIDSLNQLYRFTKNGTITEEANLATIEKVQIKHCIKTFQETNYILIDFHLKHGKTVNVLETKTRKIKDELTTIRDAKLLFDTFVELDFAKVALETIHLSK